MTAPSPQPEKTETTKSAFSPVGRPVDTARLLVAGFSLIKTVLSVAALTLLEWSRIKARRAEDQAAAATSELESLKAGAAIKEAADAKGPDRVIDDFLAERK